MLRTLLVICLAASLAALIACGSNNTPTTPTPAPAPAPTPVPAPAPAPTTAGIQGTVLNTSGATLTGARVTVIDGPNSGVSVLTNANGSYRFDVLSIANMNFSATATGYLEARSGTFVDGTNTLNFVLAPVPPPPPPPPPPVTPTITIASRLISGGTGTPTQEWGFTASSNVTGFTSYDWDFGDGTTASGSRADEQHVYRRRGTFKVTVSGHRGSGDPVIGTIDIVV